MDVTGWGWMEWALLLWIVGGSGFAVGAAWERHRDR